MKKITIWILMLFLSLTGFAQFQEGFESSNLPDYDADTWNLGTTQLGSNGIWGVFDNGVGTGQSWTINSGVADPPLVCQGTQAAYINREYIPHLSTSQDFLATPLITIPQNGELRFVSRTTLSGNQNTVYKIMWAPATANQNDPSAYVLIEDFTEDELNTIFNICEEKVIDLEAYENQQGYIAFVREYYAAIDALFGDRWLLDNVRIHEKCLDPTDLQAAPQATTATLSWTNPGSATTFEVEVMPFAATDLPTFANAITVVGTSTSVSNTTSPTVTPLAPLTQYKYYVRAVCTNSPSDWVGPFAFTTTAMPPVCGGNYVDSGGIDGNYGSGENTTITICPTIPGEQVTVTFTSFNTEANWDGIYVYDGNSTSAPQIASTNGVGNGPMTLPGAFWGTPTLPLTFTSSSVDGCLTFNFRSDGSGVRAGWVANITCNPPPTCPKPTALVTSAVLATTATLAWTNVGPGTSWEVIALPCGSPAPTATTTGTITTENPYTFQDLAPATCYDLYVRAICSETDMSTWAGPKTISTQILPPVCGGNYVDSGGLSGDYSNNANETVTICPTIPGQQVTVTFTSFNTEANWDGIYVYDGNSTSAPQIASTNGTGNGPMTLPGAYWGTPTLPLTFTSSSVDGCLTFNFRSDSSGVRAGWVANVTCAPPPTCPKPTALVTSAVLATSATFGWTNVGPGTSWEVIALPCGSPAPTAATTGTITTENPYTFQDLAPATCYDLYVRAICSETDISTWAGPKTISTQILPPVCGGNYVDSGGLSGDYSNNANETVTICPTIPGQQVTVTFTSFNTEANWDGIYVYDGNSTSAPQIASTNGTGFGPMTTPGAYWGTPTLPLTFTSSSVDGCLTFNFKSDGGGVRAGWVANVTCAPPPTCPKPTALVTSTVLATSATFSWTNVGPGTSWEVIALPCGSPAPTAATTGVITTENSYTFTELDPVTCYDFYVRAICSETDISTWAGPKTITTQILPPVCGGNYVDTGGPNGDYPTNANQTVTICPTNPGDAVTVTFTSFNTEANWDGIYVYDGNSTSAPQIPSTNGPGNGPMTLPGAYWGTPALPLTFTSTSPDGCLTFNFRSDGSVVRPGWIASITCAPAPTCMRPNLLTSSQITQTTALLGWNQPVSPNGLPPAQWEVFVVPFGSPVPDQSSTGTIVGVNPVLISGLLPGTHYTYYVRAICADGTSTIWSVSHNFNTLPSNDECTGALMVPVNSNSSCNQVVSGTVSNATPSTQPNSCAGTSDDDVWFQFVPTNALGYHNISLQDISPANADLNFAVYSGGCDGMTLVQCYTANSGAVNNLVVGQTYFIRVWSAAATPQAINFTVCVSTQSTCLNASNACDSTVYTNTTGVANLGQIGCLFSAPNPRFFIIEIIESGPVNYFIQQSTTPGGPPNLDVDYAAWGPFANSDVMCNGIPNIPPLTGLTTGCSYSAAPTETFNIPNALAGQFYVILITNFSNNPGTITMTQTNAGLPGAGVTACCPEANFSYPQSAYCTTDPDPTAVIVDGSLPGVFTATPSGLVFSDSATGLIDLSESTPGVYVVRNTLVADEDCDERFFDYTVVISAPINATISYPLPTYCSNDDTDVTVSFTGTTGGSFSSSPFGLSIDPVTGTIDPSQSSPGVYTVNYNILSAGACSAVQPSTQIEIIPTPTVSTPGNQTICGNYTLPVLTVGDYFDAPGGTGNQLNAGDVISTTQTIYVYSSVSGCTDEESFIVTIEGSADVLSDVTVCDSYILPVLSANNNYFTGPGGTGTMLNAGDTIDATQLIYIYLQSTACVDESSFTVNVGDITADVLPDVTRCDSYTLPVLSANNNYFTASGGTGTALFAGDQITQGQTVYIWAAVGACTDQSTFVVTINATPVLAPRGNQVVCDSYTLPAPSAGAAFYDAPGGTGTAYAPGAILGAGTHTIYEYAQSGTAPDVCTAEVSFTVSVTASPVVDHPQDVTGQCGPYTLGALVSGAYYTQSGGQGQQLQAGDVISSSQTLYVWAQSGTCSDEWPFTVTIGTMPSFTIDSGCQGSDYVLSAVAANGFTPQDVQYQWSTAGGTIQGDTDGASVIVSGAGTYSVTVNWDGCVHGESIVLDGTGCTIQKGISPNGDGYNDYFDLEGQSVSRLQIFNRYGTVVYSRGGYTNQWSGQGDNGEELPDGTYYYVIDRTGGEARTGWVYISRERN